MREQYAAQLRLLLRLIPLVAKERDFALKGGTAINLFYRDLPRYSVDIDLVYLPIQSRDESLKGIADGLNRLTATTNGAMPDVKASMIAGGDNQETRIQVHGDRTTVKIETSPVLRGTLFPPEDKMVSEAVEDEFGFAEMPVVTFEELFAGKIVAALDRAHPRDLFDIHHLIQNEGISDDLFRVFLVYLASSGRPMHELLNPGDKDLTQIYTNEFDGMTAEPITLETLYAARTALITDIQKRLSGDAAEFLLGLHEGKPDFTLIDLPQASELPAIKWKLLNIRSFKADNPDRHAQQRAALEALFSS